MVEEASNTLAPELLDRYCEHHVRFCMGTVTKHGSIQTCLHHLSVELLQSNWDRHPQEPKLPNQMFCLERMTL